MKKKYVAIIIILMIYCIFAFNNCVIFGAFNTLNSKDICNKELKEFNTPNQRSFDEPIFRLPNELKYPVVVKPTNGHSGKDVYVNIRDDNELYRVTSLMESRYVVEEHIFKKNEYRILVNSHLGIFTIMHRDSIFVIGDGIHNIQELAKLKDNIQREEVVRYSDITVDDRVVNRMRIPKKDEKIIVNLRKNKSQGSNISIIENSEMHDDNIEYVNKILEKTNMGFIGLDILSNDLSVSYKQEPIVLIEINSCPGFMTFPRHFIPLIQNMCFITFFLLLLL
jgi:cyanophycin synthetase